MKKTRLILLGALSILATLATAVPGASANSDYPTEANYLVTITNNTDGQYLTPPNFAAHDRSVRIFRRGQAASPGVQAVAENGGVGVLAGELKANIDDAGLGDSTVGADAPIRPRQSATFQISSDAERFSLVSMLICTNDGFAGLSNRQLPKIDGQTRRFGIPSYDAGTEINTELKADIVPAPFCQEGAGTGTGMSNPALAENSVIRRHRGIQGVGNLGPNFDWDDPVAFIEITRVPAVATYEVTITNDTSGQYLTPPNWITHQANLSVFNSGEAASPGVQAVAENGGVPVLAAELADAVAAAGIGSSGVAGPVGDEPGPIFPGESRTFTIQSNADRLSIVSMLICTNDGFGGVNGQSLPNTLGNTRRYVLRDYDAGTEINTELKADIVPAPFCQEGAGTGTGMSNPALAENGVIGAHPGIEGVGDLGPNFDWPGRKVGTVRVTRVG